MNSERIRESIVQTEIKWKHNRLFMYLVFQEHVVLCSSCMMDRKQRSKSSTGAIVMEIRSILTNERNCITRMHNREIPLFNHFIVLRFFRYCKIYSILEAKRWSYTELPKVPNEMETDLNESKITVTLRVSLSLSHTCNSSHFRCHLCWRWSDSNWGRERWAMRLCARDIPLSLIHLFNFHLFPTSCTYTWI